jgi:hypothetical protein
MPALRKGHARAGRGVAAPAFRSPRRNLREVQMRRARLRSLHVQPLAQRCRSPNGRPTKGLVRAHWHAGCRGGARSPVLAMVVSGARGGFRTQVETSYVVSKPRTTKALAQAEPQMDAAEGLAPRRNGARPAPEGAAGDGIDAPLPAQSTVSGPDHRPLRDRTLDRGRCRLALNDVDPCASPLVQDGQGCARN